MLALMFLPAFVDMQVFIRASGIFFCYLLSLLVQVCGSLFQTFGSQKPTQVPGTRLRMTP